MAAPKFDVSTLTRQVEMKFRQVVSRQSIPLSRQSRTQSFCEQLKVFVFWQRRENWMTMVKSQSDTALNSNPKKRKQRENDALATTSPSQQQQRAPKKARASKSGRARPTATNVMESQMAHWNISSVVEVVLRQVLRECNELQTLMLRDRNAVDKAIQTACDMERSVKHRIMEEFGRETTHRLLKKFFSVQLLTPLHEVVSEAAEEGDVWKLTEDHEFVVCTTTFLLYFVLNLSLGRHKMRTCINEYVEGLLHTRTRNVAMLTIGVKLMHSWMTNNQGVNKHLTMLISCIECKMPYSMASEDRMSMHMNNAILTTLNLLDVDMPLKLLHFAIRPRLQVEILQKMVEHRHQDDEAWRVNLQNKAHVADNWHFCFGATRWAFNVNMIRRIAHANILITASAGRMVLMGGEVLEGLEQVADRSALAAWRGGVVADAPLDRVTPLRIFSVRDRLNDSSSGSSRRRDRGDSFLHSVAVAQTQPLVADGREGSTSSMTFCQNMFVGRTAAGNPIYPISTQNFPCVQVGVRHIPINMGTTVTRITEFVFCDYTQQFKWTDGLMPVMHTHAVFDMIQCTTEMSPMTMLQFVCKQTCIPWTLARINALVFHKKHKNKSATSPFVPSAKVNVALREKKTWTWPDLPFVFIKEHRHEARQRTDFITPRWVSMCASHTLMSEAQAVRDAGWKVVGTLDGDEEDALADGAPRAWGVLSMAWRKRFGSRLPSVLHHFRHMEVHPRSMTMWGTGQLEKQLVVPEASNLPISFFHKPGQVGCGVVTPLHIPYRVMFNVCIHRESRSAMLPVPPSEKQWNEWILHGKCQEDATEIASTPELIFDVEEEDDDKDMVGGGHLSDASSIGQTSLLQTSDDEDDDDNDNDNDDDDTFSTASAAMTAQQKAIEKKEKEAAAKSILRIALRVPSQIDPNLFHWRHTWSATTTAGLSVMEECDEDTTIEM